MIIIKRDVPGNKRKNSYRIIIENRVDGKLTVSRYLKQLTLVYFVTLAFF
jgi:hypothetical protein